MNLYSSQWTVENLWNPVIHLWSGRRLWVFLLLLLMVKSYGQTGRVGINTTAPSALLHVKDSSILFEAPAVLPQIPGLPPVSGSGIRMMWYSPKAAFRAGRVTGSQWDRDSIGIYSFAAGQNVKARGTHSIALGNGTNATGTSAVAIGSGTQASGGGSLALGTNTHASGNVSSAFGSGSHASGSSSTAMGSNSVASGNISTAIGASTIASGNNSVAMGASTSASGVSATAMGNGTQASGTASTSTGFNTRAKGSNSTAMGLVTQANGFSSLVIGQYNDTLVPPQNAITGTTPLLLVGNGDPGMPSNAMVVRKDGRVGIGTNTPEAELDVAGQIRIAGGSPGMGKVLTSDATGMASWQTPITGADNLGNHIATQNIQMQGRYLSHDGDNEGLFVTSLGQIGIGTNTPQTQLDVAGQIKIQGGTPGAGKVLTSDASGLATWQTPANTADNLGNHQATQNIQTKGHWISNDGGNEGLYIDPNGQVGIGTTIPQALLTVFNKSTLFYLNSLPNPPAETPMQYGGFGLMWYADKASFRVGRAAPFDWAKDSIGLYSGIVGGEWNQGKGQSSFIGAGSSNTASALNSFIGGGQLNTVTGSYSAIAGGTGNLTSGLYSFVGGGFTNTASGSSSFIAGGNNHQASGQGSMIAGGSQNLTSGDHSFASGTQNTVLGIRGFIAGGYNNVVSGNNGFIAGGNDNIVSGASGIATGGGLYARSLCEVVVGLNSTDYTPLSPNGFHNNDRLFVIANGPSNFTRRNALTVLKSGKIGIDTEEPQVKLHITGGTDANDFSATSGYVVVGQTDGINIVMDNNEIMARNNGVVSPLYLQNDGGNISVGGAAASYQLTLSQNSAAKPTSNTWTVPSDARLKKDIHNYEDGLEEILQIHTVRYTYTGEAGMPEEEGIGVLAQELQHVAPYMVGTWTHENEDGSKSEYLSVDNGAMTYMLINAVKEQQAMILHLQATNAKLEERLAALEARL